MAQAQTAGYIFEEQRGAERSAVALDAQGIFPNINQAIDCTILDISETGAKIEMKSVDMVPRRFKLFVPETDTLCECLVVRRSGKHVGLVFESRIDLTSA